MFTNVYIKLKSAWMSKETWESIIETHGEDFITEMGLMLESVNFNTDVGGNGPSMSSNTYILGVFEYNGEHYLLCTEGNCTADEVDGKTVLGALVLKPCATQSDKDAVYFECLVSSELADTIFNTWYPNAKLDADFHRVPGLIVDEEIFDVEDIPKDYFYSKGKEYVATI